jgi:hypothetical protein
MIVKPSEMKFEGKKLFIIVAGVPGIGKTTLALSAPKPLLIDLDKGVDRVETRYRTDTDVVSSYEELKNDLEKADLSPYETIVIDTGGKLLEMLKPVVIARDQKNAQTNGELSLKGYGAVKKMFNEFVTFVKSLNKHLVMVFHATEVADGETTKLRIRMEGKSRDEVWDSVDIGGFMEMRGNKRTIGFSNCDRYYAKGTHGIHGVYDIPTLANGNNNTFLTELINNVINDLTSENKEFTEYQELMRTLLPHITNADNAKLLNKAYDEVKKAEHKLTSKNELWNALNERAKALGLVYDKDRNVFDNAKPTK